MRLKEYTRTWWEKKLDTGIDDWLVRLRATEFDAASRFQLALDTWPITNTDDREAFCRIMADERRHSEMVERVLVQQGIAFPVRAAVGRERYWEQVWPHVTGFRFACAALALGETLAMTRFNVILEHNRTPEFVRKLVADIVPDERRHINDLAKIAGPLCFQVMKEHHRAGMKALNIG